MITTDFEDSLFFVNIGNSIRTGEFKKLTFTLAAGEYWNTHTSENDYLAKVFIYDDDNPAILTEGSEPMQVTIDLERYKYFKQIELKGSIHRNIIISNVRFWR